MNVCERIVVDCEKCQDGRCGLRVVAKWPVCAELMPGVVFTVAGAQRCRLHSTKCMAIGGEGERRSVGLVGVWWLVAGATFWNRSWRRRAARVAAAAKPDPAEQRAESSLKHQLHDPCMYTQQVRLSESEEIPLYYNSSLLYD